MRVNKTAGVGQQLHLKTKLTRTLVSTAIVASLALAAWGNLDTPTVAGGETRTISLYHVHTKEKLTVTYMKNGRYVPSAMKQINHLLRDWRRNETITIDPRSIDLVWELHADLGSHRPINIVCGYRSPRTNAFLKRIGRNVAKKSQHMRGKAIDFFFPDVTTDKIRNSALARSVGGVGYYRSAGGPTGFLHVDSGNVRHWGPGMSPSQIAGLIAKGRKSVGKRLGRDDMVQVADASGSSEDEGSGGIFGFFKKSKKKTAPVAEETVVAQAEPPATPLEQAYASEDDELADLSADAAAAEKAPKIVPPPSKVEDVATLAPEAPAPSVGNKSKSELAALASSASVESLGEEQSATQPMVPRPRLKPKAVMVVAAAASQNVTISPASAEPDMQSWQKKPSQVADALGTVPAADSLLADEELATTESNAAGKSSLAAELRNGTAEDVVVIKPVLASVDNAEPGWWSMFYSNAEASLRRDGAPPKLDAEQSGVMPVAAVLGPDGTGPATALVPQHSAEGKGDSLAVNREGKTGLPSLKLRLSSREEVPTISAE